MQALHAITDTTNSLYLCVAALFYFILFLATRYPAQGPGMTNPGDQSHRPLAGHN